MVVAVDAAVREEFRFRRYGENFPSDYAIDRVDAAFLVVPGSARVPGHRQAGRFVRLAREIHVKASFQRSVVIELGFLVRVDVIAEQERKGIGVQFLVADGPEGRAGR
jgi:hypothetical protein